MLNIIKTVILLNMLKKFVYPPQKKQKQQKHLHTVYKLIWHIISSFCNKWSQLKNKIFSYNYFLLPIFQKPQKELLSQLIVMIRGL